ncbi:MAG: PEP-CTERM sorting domain-containing protein [Burkholderiaceae bacterium]
MKTSTFFPALAVAAAVTLFAASAAADTVVLDATNSTFDSLIGATSGTVNGVSFVAAGGTGTFSRGASIGGYTGFGVSGGIMQNEIDIGETITVSLGSLHTIRSFDVAFLFNGPEFGDVNERVTVTAFNSVNSTSQTATLTATGDNSAFWTFNSQTIVSLSLAADGSAGAWRVSDPFGSFQYDSLVFGAASGVCRTTTGCSGSDYALMAVTVAPEPQVFALMLAGLGAVGFLARRRRLQN